MSSAEALERAVAAGYDLVEIAPGATPPVVKILDWGKYKYELTKQVQKNRKQQKQSEIKQVRLGLKIGDHDLDFKIKHARNFLGEGNKVKVALRFKGPRDHPPRPGPCGARPVCRRRCRHWNSRTAASNYGTRNEYGYRSKQECQN